MLESMLTIQNYGEKFNVERSSFVQYWEHRGVQHLQHGQIILEPKSSCFQEVQKQSK